MLTGVYETLRAAGRPLVLELGERPGLDERLDEFARSLGAWRDESGAGETARATADGRSSCSRSARWPSVCSTSPS